MVDASGKVAVVALGIGATLLQPRALKLAEKPRKLLALEDDSTELLMVERALLGVAAVRACKTGFALVIEHEVERRNLVCLILWRELLFTIGLLP